MTTTDLTGFRDLLAANRAELSGRAAWKKSQSSAAPIRLRRSSTSQRENLLSPVSIANPRSAETSNWP